ncbi:TonB-dependent receptor [Halioxenophilus aromaticivorans]|uniref:TonB-dependent receptor n=1 Tax=Halioxenophilus aromaticivorans TaxID=1306992 RepID=A0AAV3U9I8_9ALTE
MTLTCPRLTLLLTSLAAHTALADGVHIEEINVIGRHVETATTASHGQISGEQLGQRPILRTGEILEVVPGLVATQHSGSGKANQYFLRGFNLDHGTDFSTTVDAMPVNMPSHGHGQGYADLNFIIPELVASIAYKKGAYYADLADFSGTGGAQVRSVNYLNDSQLELGVGNYNHRRLLATGSLLSAGGAEFIYGLEAQKYDGPWDDISEDVDKKNLWLKQVWGDEENLLSITAMAYQNSWNSADQIPRRAVQQGIISDLGSIDTTLGGESNRYSLSGHWLKTGSDSVLDVNLYAIGYDMNLWSNFTYFTQPQGDQFEQVDDRTIAGWDARYALNSEFNSLSMTNTFGSQLRHDDIDQVGLFASNQRVRTGVFRQDEVQQTSLGWYWQNRLQWSEKLSTTLGVRYDRYWFDVNALAAADPSTLAVNSGDSSDDIVTGSFNVAYQFNSHLNGFFSVGQGFHSNDARGTSIQRDPVTGETVDPVDPLVPTLGYELGLRNVVSNNIELSAALWYLEVDSELLFVGDAGTTEDTGVGSERTGLELTLYARLGEKHLVDVEYSYTDAQFVQPLDGSRDIPGALQDVFSLGLNTQWTEQFYTHLRVRHFGDYALDGGAQAEPSTLVNLRAGMQFNERWQAKLDILNLLDADDADITYYYASQLQTEAQSVDDIHYHVFEPRAFRLSVGYHF